MQLRHLRYFVKIVEAGSFSRAATTIHVAQPALSQQIGELEEEIGVSLLHRTARGVRPTPAGDVLYREAVAILRQMEQLPGVVRSSGGAPQGPVSLGMSSTLSAVFSAAFISQCKARLPKVNLSFVLGDSLLLKSRLLAGTLDLALAFEDEAGSGFTRHPLFRQRLYLIHRTPLPFRTRTISIKALATVPLLLPTHPNVTRTKLDEVFAGAGIAPLIVAETNVLSGMLSAVQEGIGGTILPKGDLSDVPGHATLAAVPIEPAITLTASIVSAAAAPLTRAGEAVRALLAAFVADALKKLREPGIEWVGDDGAISADDSPIGR